MPDLPSENSTVGSTAASVQQSIPVALLTWQEAEEQRKLVALETSIEVQQRVEVIQKLISAQGTDCYGKVQQLCNF